MKGAKDQSNFHIGYVFSHVETFIDIYAKTHRISADELTSGLSEILSSQREGPEHEMSSPLVSNGASSSHSTRAKEKMAVRSHLHEPHGQASEVGVRVKRKLSAAGRRKISMAQKARWTKIREQTKEKRKKKHWTQLPKNKARLRKLLKKATEARTAANNSK